ncbi:MAG: DUF4153 domain-containing protein, partial [Hymenobacteraceae bacterium]|nr:DUF4153 domain-containing protein [Hymenobacteraceae bacterium]MDX5394867.1 DUF4153 domain-containing protein [Hymenobacteraceae bacterium]MDX5510902.1 DUF4153 domain-containing protein [Hymenobacteraceae bacterium]
MQQTGAILFPFFHSNEERSIAIRLILTFALGFFLFFNIELAALRYKLSFRLQFVLKLVGAILLAAFFMYLPDELLPKQVLQTFLLVLGLFLLSTCIAYLNWQQVNGFWQFNRIMFTRLFEGGIYAAVLFAGIAAALLAVHFLFEVKIKEEIYVQLWLAIAGVFLPWFVLAGVPDNLKALQRLQFFPNSLRLFLLYVLVHMSLLYL